MTYIRRLVRVELAAQMSLVAIALLFATFMVVFRVDTDGQLDGAGIVVRAIGTFALLVYFYCIGPVALVIAPIYAALEARTRANAATAICIGLVPGILVLVYSVTPFAASKGTSYMLTFACLATGASIAMGVHLVRTWDESR